MSSRATGTKVPIARQNAYHALRQAGYSRVEVQKILHMGGSTAWALGKREPPSPATVQRIKKGLAAKHLRTADHALDALTDELLVQNPNAARQLSIISAIHTEKALLLDGKATQIIDYQRLNKDLVDVEAEIVELEGELKKIES